MFRGMFQIWVTQLYSFFIKKGFGASFPQELFFHQSKIIPFKFGYVLTGDQNLVNLGKHSHG